MTGAVNLPSRAQNLRERVFTVGKGFGQKIVFFFCFFSTSKDNSCFGNISILG